MSFYKDFLALGYSENEAQKFAYLVESLGNDQIANIELNEATEALIDKFNKIGCTSFRMDVDEFAKIMKG